MTHDAPLFLTPDEAVDAVRIDFQQYDPQLMLFSEILPIITNGQHHLKRDPPKNGAWINTGSRGHMRWLAGPELITHMCKTLTHTSLSPDQVVAICARVFHTRVEAGVSPDGDKEGLFIETGMAQYNCRQCGQCCRTLDYHREITAEDVDRWRTLDRQDILEWVGVFKTAGQTTYRIWIQPGTGALAAQCPFLIQPTDKNAYTCAIHAIKPGVCSDYPVSRKHALMTGCLGFEKDGYRQP